MYIILIYIYLEELQLSYQSYHTIQESPQVAEEVRQPTLSYYLTVQNRTKNSNPHLIFICNIYKNMSLSGFGDYYPAGTKVIYDNGTSDILTSKFYLKPGNYHLGKKIKSVDTTGISDPIEIARLNENLAEYLSGRSPEETERLKREERERRRQEEIVRREQEERERWRRERAEAEERQLAYEADAPARALRELTRRTDDITRRNNNPVQTPNPDYYGTLGSYGGSKSRRGQKRKKSRKSRSRKTRRRR